jgi:hypothetical protein
LTTWPLVGLATAAAGSGALLLILQSHLTFSADDWAFLLGRRGFSIGVFLNPHNDHIAIAPVAIYKALLAVFGLSSALPFQVVSTLVFLLSVALLFVYLRRRLGGWAALLGSVLILFIGAAWSDLLWSFQIGYFGSMAAGIGALLALDREDRKGDLLACALLVLATSFSELGVPFIVGAFVNLALGPSPRLKRLYVPVVPVALYAIWYIGWDSGRHSGTFDNFVNSPKFVFDAVSENFASLLGLATPLSGRVVENNHVGLIWGQTLLVITLAITIRWLWRGGRPSRWLWAALAAGATFWFLTALNAIPVLRQPTASRYQYPGAIFLLLIVSELLRGAQAGKRLLIAATAVTVAAATSGLIFLHDGYRADKQRSDALRARLAAVEIGRGAESRELLITFPPFSLVPARIYLSAVDAFGSPALSESQLAASKYRGFADQFLARAERIALGLGPTTAARRLQSGCRSAGRPSDPTSLAMLPGDYTLAAPGELGASVFTARFADRPSVVLGIVSHTGGASLSIPRDSSTRPWRLYSDGPVTVCTIAGAQPQATG